ncbi:putative PEP-binding protein [Spirillospora sp. CA-142024]|uniref:putative PEP-binding protein n=1 Tax=Spirillospora sp. CA-142024 TaxID=3240036 RepID=UPI003D8D9073
MTTGTTTLIGEVAAPGTALGFAHRTDRPAEASLPRRGAGDPVRRITDAFAAVAADLARLAERLRTRGRPHDADIMEVTGYIARDPDLLAAAVRRAEQGVPATVAIRQAVTWHADAIAALDDPILAERAADVRQVGRRALAWLDGRASHITAGPLVLVAQEIGAADLLDADAPIVAALSVTGGPNSHAAIVARSLCIPLLVGIDPAVLDLEDGVELLIDGEHGRIQLDPPAAEREAVLAQLAHVRALQEAYASERDQPCRTADGHEVTLRANIATPDEARAALEVKADGIGLLRTELPFLDATRWPTQTLHTRALLPILAKLAGEPVTVRTLDFADDKLPPFLAHEREGERIARWLPEMLAVPDALGAQFRAILSAAPAGTELRIMIPMVADLAELHACRRLLHEAAAAIAVPPPPLGIMIELPQAVERAHELTAASEFVSIGTNDLTGQILGLDRRDPAAGPAMTAHPRVLTAIARAVRAAHGHGRTVSVCGDAAAHPLVFPLLLGLGVDILSAAPAGVDEIRHRIRRLRIADCMDMAKAALECDTVQQAWTLVRERTQDGA